MTYGYDNEDVYAKAVGRKVVAVELLNESSASIAFEDEHHLVLDLEGECCSSSYYTDTAEEGFKGLVGSTIKSIEERAGRSDTNSDPSTDDDYGRTLWSFLVITTDKGHVTIDWRNDSNGYYSGYVSPDFW